MSAAAADITFSGAPRPQASLFLSFPALSGVSIPGWQGGGGWCGWPAHARRLFSQAHPQVWSSLLSHGPGGKGGQMDMHVFSCSGFLQQVLFVIACSMDLGVLYSNEYSRVSNLHPCAFISSSFTHGPFYHICPGPVTWLERSSFIDSQTRFHQPWESGLSSTESGRLSCLGVTRARGCSVSRSLFLSWCCSCQCPSTS